MAKQCEQLPLLLSVLIFVLLAANANAQSHSPILLSKLHGLLTIQEECSGYEIIL